MLSSRKKGNKSPGSVELQKMNNVKMVSNIKHIGVIHAYKPQQLKECLVRNTKSYNNFYDRNGKCSSNEIFFRSVIAHFREWKKELSLRMLEVFDIIMTVDQLQENHFEDQVMGVLKQLKDYGANLRGSIDQILQSGAYKTQVLKLSDKY